MGSSGRVPPRAPPPTSRVAYLGQHYSNQRLSGEASDLLLSSWRQKSAQSYDSDPVSGPIEDVVNILAHLHTERYQHRSLNAYICQQYPLCILPSMGSQLVNTHLFQDYLKGRFSHAHLYSRYTETCYGSLS